jgi:hypothetical protein
MSYNGSKFDNHFMLRAIKDQNNDWVDRVNITGDLTEMKIMKFDNILFYDLKLMMGSTMSLKDFLKSFGIQTGKIDIDISVFESLESVMNHRD